MKKSFSRPVDHFLPNADGAVTGEEWMALCHRAIGRSDGSGSRVEVGKMNDWPLYIVGIFFIASTFDGDRKRWN